MPVAHRGVITGRGSGSTTHAPESGRPDPRAPPPLHNAGYLIYPTTSTSRDPSVRHHGISTSPSTPHLVHPLASALCPSTDNGTPHHVLDHARHQACGSRVLGRRRLLASPPPARSINIKIPPLTTRHFRSPAHSPRHPPSTSDIHPRPSELDTRSSSLFRPAPQPFGQGQPRAPRSPAQRRGRIASSPTVGERSAHRRAGRGTAWSRGLPSTWPREEGGVVPCALLGRAAVGGEVCFSVC